MSPDDAGGYAPPRGYRGIRGHPDTGGYGGAGRVPSRTRGGLGDRAWTHIAGGTIYPPGTIRWVGPRDPMGGIWRERPWGCSLGDPMGGGTPAGGPARAGRIYLVLPPRRIHCQADPRGYVTRALEVCVPMGAYPSDPPGTFRRVGIHRIGSVHFLRHLDPAGGQCYVGLVATGSHSTPRPEEAP